MTRVFLTADTVGGVWQYATDLAEALTRLGVEPVLATLGPPPTASQTAALPDIELVETGLQLDWLSVNPREVTEAGHALARLADRQQADIVHLNAPALAAETPFDQALVAVAHSCVGTWWQAVRGGRIDPDLGWRAQQTGRGLRMADRVIAPSGAFATMLQHCYDLPKPPVVVRNGRTAFAIGPAETADFAFTAGRLWDEGKNVAVLDRAATMTRAPIQAAGPCKGPNGAAIVLDHVQALGILDEAGMAAKLAHRPIFVTAAVYEPFGLAVLEAAQAGCQLLLSDIPTFRELWDGAARFVYPHDAEGYARAIDDLIADPALRTRLGEQARERARDYSVERMADAMLAIYRDLAVPVSALEAA